MPSLRYRQNYKAVTLQNPTDSKHREVIPAYLRDGSLVFFPFGGFVDRGMLNHEQFVKLTRIDGFAKSNDGSGGWEDIPTSTILGIFHAGIYYVVLKDDRPIVM